jgi:hypothetical protein
MTSRSTGREGRGRMAKAKPLTKAERAWLLELEVVLLRCPKRIELYTTGDAMLTAVDATEFRAVGDKRDYSDFDQYACSLGEITSGCKIHGIA